MKRLFLILSLLCSISFSEVAFGREMDEHILRFHSDILIDTTGRIEVTEHITVYSMGDYFKHGIARTIPQIREDKDGIEHKLPIKIISVMCNGNKEPYSKKNIEDNLSLRIGRKGTVLSEGSYEYVIKYQVFGHVGFFDGFDELYWNVTGNSNNITVEEASARVLFPEGAKCIRATAYTGLYGSKEQSCEIIQLGNGYEFIASRPLGKFEGLTVAAAFTPNVVIRKAPSIMYNYGDWVIAGGIVLICLLYFLITWMVAGKDDRKDIAVPEYRPPHGWTPSTLSYIYNNSYDSSSFAATLISMAIHGGATIITEEKDKYSIIKGSEEKLNDEEKVIFDTLFTGDKEKTGFSPQKTPQTFGRAYDRLFKLISGNNNLDNYNTTNAGYILLGWIITLLLGYSYFWFDYVDLWSLLAMIGILIAENIVYMLAIQKRTKEGMKVEAEIRGFKMYMETAEEDRLNMLTPPDKTPELFESLLPYALALGIGNKWCDKFQDALSTLDYNPSWFTDNRKYELFDWNNFSSGLGYFDRKLISSAKTFSAGKSSSGSTRWTSGSSSGHSGGGGGGGSTGGW